MGVWIMGLNESFDHSDCGGEHFPVLVVVLPLTATALMYVFDADDPALLIKGGAVKGYAEGRGCETMVGGCCVAGMNALERESRADGDMKIVFVYNRPDGRPDGAPDGYVVDEHGETTYAGGAATPAAQVLPETYALTDAERATSEAMLSAIFD